MSCIAFSPRTVTEVEIFSLRRMEKVRTVYRALPNTGCCPVSCSSTCARSNGQSIDTLPYLAIISSGRRCYMWQLSRNSAWQALAQPWVLADIFVPSTSEGASSNAL